MREWQTKGASRIQHIQQQKLMKDETASFISDMEVARLVDAQRRAVQKELMLRGLFLNLHSFFAFSQEEVERAFSVLRAQAEAAEIASVLPPAPPPPPTKPRRL